ncbi:MAG: OmpA family protein [bacterium]|nr:OmpA family protein [bacterium]
MQISRSHPFPRVTGSAHGFVTPWIVGVSLIAFALGSVSCASSGTSIADAQVFAENAAVASLNTQLETARAAGHDVLAPDGVNAASELLDQAIAEAREGNQTGAGKFAEKGLARLAKAAEDSETASEALRDVLAARRRAAEAGAESLLSDRWEEAEEQLVESASLIEEGDLEGAMDETPELIEAYSALELEALESDATALARAAIDAARDADAKDYAPQTFKRARKELEIATGILETDRSRVEAANVHARQASAFAARSQYIAALAKEFERRDYDREEVILWYQEQLSEVAKPLGDEIAFTQPNHEVITGTRLRIEELLAASEQIEEVALAVQAETLEAEARLAMESAQEARYDRVQRLFSEDEAVVSRRGKNVVLSTYGFEFAVGDSEIGSSNFPLLNKISQAIEEFGDPSIIVSGHTDATGSDSLNQRLSTERAKKVGDFLVQIGKLEPARVSTRGLGETQPLASNETVAGRARNRRIEILIVNDPKDLMGSDLPAVSGAPPSN